MAVQTATLLLLATGLIRVKIAAIRMNDRRQRRRDQIGDHLAQYSFGADCQAQLLEAACAYPSEFLDVWEAALASLKGATRSRWPS